jgi:hypothetical protein
LADFPSSIWSGNTRGANLSDAETHTTWHDDVMAEVIAIETRLGTNPSLPRGRVGYASVTSNQTTITTQVDLTGATTTFTAVSGRRYKVTGVALVASTVPGDLAGLHIATGANVQLQQTNARCDVAALGIVAIWVSTTTVSGATTWKLRVSRQTGSGSITNFAGSDFPSFILVEDIGT